MIIASPIFSVACMTAPSEADRRDSCTAPKAAAQKSISAAASRQTSIGIAACAASGAGFIAVIHDTFPPACKARVCFRGPVASIRRSFMTFDLEKSIEVLQRTPDALRALLGGLSDFWVMNNY